MAQKSVISGQAARLAENFQTLNNRLNLIFVFDHVGRSGNGFVLGIFDQHPQVATSHWVHYVYSYLITEFGDDPELDSERACEFIMRNSYFRYVFSDLDDEIAAHIYKAGGDPDTQYDRRLCRDVFRAIVLAAPVISRRDLVAAAYYATLAGMGRDTAELRYIMVADSVSLRTEHVLQGFSGKVMQAALHDFPQMKAVSLVRDPRAMFASNRHQFVNVLGNMYAVTPASACRRLRELWRCDFRMYSTVWPFWLTYGAATTRCIYRLRRQYGAYFRVLRNEDLNLHFVPTMERVAGWLGIDMLPQWHAASYVPTSMGMPWKGTGAYNSRYQPRTNGMLANDPQHVAEGSAGPNSHVTTRWRSKLAPHEIRLLELLFAEELEELGYDSACGKAARLSVRSCLLRPFRGELPSASWIVRGLRESLAEGGRRLFYAVVFPVYYAVARVAVWRLYRKGFFSDISGGEVRERLSLFLSPVHRTKP
jgi:hypothetical protein